MGLFSIGGIRRYSADSKSGCGNRGWLTFNEFTDLLAIAEMTPGPIAINSATFADADGRLVGRGDSRFRFVFPL